MEKLLAMPGVPANTRPRSSGRIPLFVGLLAFLTVLGAACSGPTRSEDSVSPAATQTSEAGQVTVAVTWAGPSDGAVFEVVLDTHVVDLDGIDLEQLAVLRTDQGGEVAPVRWDAPKGGHHRRGTLSFPSAASDGSPLIGADTQIVELIVRDVAGVPERSFRWSLE